MTIRDIAGMAGVSTAAVSRYFNNGYISDEKREAIRKVVEKTGYYPSMQAQTLRTKRTRLLGVIIPRLDSGSIARVVAGVMDAASRREYQILLANTMNDNMKELEYLSVFHEKQVDGVVLVGTLMTPQHEEALANMEVPVIVVGQRLTGFNSVSHDDYNASYDITKLMLEKGRKRLAYIGVTSEDKAVGESRYRGYCDAVTSVGFHDLIYRTVVAEFSMESGYEKMNELMDKYDDIDGVVVATDTLAAGAMRCLKEHGKKIPSDVMICGQGNSMVSRALDPELTTIRYYYEESGRTAAEMILDMIEAEEAGETGGNEPDMPVREIKLGYELMDRASTANN
ncbi:MAG: LacI family DNA-binding transcriptional regulator [Eubacterium sp.]|nr:LacI family DNA-binding transcriptional regulator [Eubacterium sp.]